MFIWFFYQPFRRSCNIFLVIFVWFTFLLFCCNIFLYYWKASWMVMISCTLLKYLYCPTPMPANPLGSSLEIPFHFGEALEHHETNSRLWAPVVFEAAPQLVAELRPSLKRRRCGSQLVAERGLRNPQTRVFRLEDPWVSSGLFVEVLTWLYFHLIFLCGVLCYRNAAGVDP